jgi:hypothetical protein
VNSAIVGLGPALTYVPENGVAGTTKPIIGDGAAVSVVGNAVVVGDVVVLDDGCGVWTGACEGACVDSTGIEVT